MIVDKNTPIRHVDYMRMALNLARKSPLSSSNYRVGALLIDADIDVVVSQGFTLECEGNTHAEQCCLIKLSRNFDLPEEKLEHILPKNTILYTTVEPCSRRLSGALSCVDRILLLKNNIRTVYVGLLEPDIFVNENNGREKLECAGIRVVHVSGLETEILEVATAGHHS